MSEVSDSTTRMTSPASSTMSYARILHSSKVINAISPDATRIPQAITAPAAYRSRRDYGLKRRMPPQLLTTHTPYFTLKSVDTDYGQTDYKTASHQVSFTRMWRENECSVHSAPPEHTLTSHVVKPIRLDMTHFDAQSGRVVKERREVDVAAMSQRQFEVLIKSLKDKREEFRRFLSQKEEERERRRRQHSQDGASQESPVIDLFEFAQGSHQSPVAYQRTLSEFLHYLSTGSTSSSEGFRKVNQPKLIPNPHPNLGLAYSHKDSLHTHILAEPVPGRVVEHGYGSSKGDGRQQAVVSGIVAPIGGSGGVIGYGSSGRGNVTSSDPHLNVTQFEPDPITQQHDTARGRATFQIVHASIDPHHLPRRYDFQSFKQQQSRELPGSPVKYRDPSQRNSAVGLENGRLQMVVKESNRLRQLRTTSSNLDSGSIKLGQQDWIATEETLRSGLSSQVDWLTEYLKSSSSNSSTTNRRSFQKTTPSNSNGQSIDSSTPRTGREADDALLRLLNSMGRSSSS